MEKILTKHPEGKKGVNIDKAKYDVIKKAIIESLEKEELSYTQITKFVKDKLDDSFEGSIGWYVETVKLDLEARNLIKRITTVKPELYRLNKDNID
jgi:hypothetical protein